MKHFSAQYIFTNTGPPIKRGIVSAGEDGMIMGVDDTGGNLVEKDSVEFHNGIIIPGFVNCHCHLELSHMMDLIPPKSGLAEFLRLFRTGREAAADEIISSAYSADNEMFRDGTVSPISAPASPLQKKSSKIKYISLLEAFGIDPEKAARRMNGVSSPEMQNLLISVIPLYLTQYIRYP
jgi:cytosine/adenosine deaminase-related metal-dependent hydrolase